MSAEKRIQRWCGICFAWREQVKGRCRSCGNAHMRGGALPVENEGRSSGQDNASREGVGLRVVVDSTLPRDIMILRDPITGAESGRYIGPLPSARTSAEAPSTDCPPSQPKDVT